VTAGKVWRNDHDRSHACGSEPKGEGARAWVRQASKGVLFICAPDLLPRHADCLSLTQDCTGFDTRLGASRDLRTNTTSTACLTDKHKPDHVFYKHNPYHVFYKHNPYHVSYGQTQPLPRVLQTQPLPRVLRTNTTPTTCLTNTNPTTCLTDKHNR